MLDGTGTWMFRISQGTRSLAANHYLLCCEALEIMQTLTKEFEGKMRQYKRVLLSYADFKHAKLSSSYVLDAELHKHYPETSYVLLEALNCSMILAYCRPFSGNTASVPDLP